MTASDLRWSFRRGDWYGVLGARTAVLLPPAEKARVAEVWELVDADAGFDEVLDVLVSRGLSDLTGFVLVGRSDDETRVVIRGAARAHLAVGDQVVHVTGEPSTTWVERAETGVTRVYLEVASDDADESAGDVTVGAGLVRVASAEHPPAVATGPTTPVATDRREPEDAVAALDIEHDGETRVPEEETGLLRPLPGIPGQPPAPVVTRPVARLLFSSGASVEVDRVVLVGRAPEAGRVVDGAEPHVVAVPSPQQEISSTHLEVRPGSGADHGSAVVTDLGSTNGTLVRQPGLPVEDLRPGVGVQLIPGAVVDLGDGQTIQVVDP